MQHTIIDRVVDAVHAGREAGAEDLAALAGLSARVFDDGDLVVVALPGYAVEQSFEDEVLVDDGEVEAADIDDAARLSFARNLIARKTENHDADEAPAFRSVVVSGSDGRSIMVIFMVRGYSFSDLDIDLYGAFAELSDFGAQLARDRYLVVDPMGRDWEGYSFSDDAILAAWKAGGRPLRKRSIAPRRYLVKLVTMGSPNWSGTLKAAACGSLDAAERLFERWREEAGRSEALLLVDRDTNTVVQSVGSVDPDRTARWFR